MWKSPSWLLSRVHLMVCFFWSLEFPLTSAAANAWNKANTPQVNKVLSFFCCVRFCASYENIWGMKRGEYFPSHNCSHTKLAGCGILLWYWGKQHLAWPELLRPCAMNFQSCCLLNDYFEDGDRHLLTLKWLWCVEMAIECQWDS